jgi:trehalose 6-phosphate synthase/phosphatase
MRERVLRNNVFVWAERFLEILSNTTEPGGVIPVVDFEELRRAYCKASQRILIFDYDGTLVRIVDDPAASRPSPELLEALKHLASDHNNVVAVLSGRRMVDMARWLGGVRELYLGAEHGLMVRRPFEEPWQKLQGVNPNLSWKDKIRPMLEHFVDRAPGSFVEEKEFSLVWHYRRVEPEFGSWLAKELLALLEELLGDTDARPVHGKKIVEVKSTWANKGEFAARLLEECGPAEFVLAAGDDATDEDMFERLDKSAITVHVGSGPSGARFRLRQRADVDKMLSELLR